MSRSRVAATTIATTTATTTAIALALATALFACAGCSKKEVGAPCRASQSTCIDTKTALVCRQSVFVARSCGGPLGCRVEGESAKCDATIAEEGATCVDDRTFACTADKQRALMCDSGQFTAYQGCRGPGGCNVVGGGLSCDVTRAEDGDRCLKPESYACSKDGQTMLECIDMGHRWKTARACRGPNACSFAQGVATCDESRSQQGDPCGTYGQLACSTDGHSELVCLGGRYELSRDCKKEGCSQTPGGHGIKCR
jgi:hypothetical protein